MIPGRYTLTHKSIPRDKSIASNSFSNTSASNELLDRTVAGRKLKMLHDSQ